MASRPKKFIFCVHAHQPVGNFGFVFEEAFERCYKPFFEVVQSHPKFPLVFHISGSLLDWLEKERPAFLKKIADLTKTQEIEFLGGAYYEPIYGLIPARDLAAQLALTRKKMRYIFGALPDGAWLTERVWEPELAGFLSSWGVKYTVLDDEHFEKAGVDCLGSGYFSTGEGNSKLDIFASSKPLRYLIPFGQIADVLGYIRSFKTDSDGVMVFADDCEKFGLWPGTHEFVYNQKWLDRFFTALEKEDGLELFTFSRYRQLFRALDAGLIPHSSYNEMMEWSGGHFNNFFEKYPESNYMKERMLQVSEDIYQKKANNQFSPEEREGSENALYKAQCNCSYWHGVFGGLYLHHLRSSVFENLIKADQNSNLRSRGFKKVELRSGSMWRLDQDEITAFFNPNYGGAMEELDYLPESVNLLCTLQRRPESYHRFAMLNGSGFKAGLPFSIYQILGVKHKGLEKKLFYDMFRRLSFIDHFFSQEVSRKRFQDSSYEDIGDFADGVYQAGFLPDLPTGGMYFIRQGLLRLRDGIHELNVKKTISSISAASLQVEYEIINKSVSEISFGFGVEFNFSIGENLPPEGVTFSGVSNHLLRDQWRGLEISLSSDSQTVAHVVPIETVSGSEAGLEGNYQQVGVLMQNKKTLAPKGSFKQIFTLGISKAS